MTDIPSIPLHPSLQKLGAVHRRRLRLLSLLLFLVFAGTLLFEMVIAFTSQDGTNLLLLGLIGLLMLPLVALMGGLMWYLDHRLSRSLNTANDLLRDCAPQTFRLTPIERASRDGVLATLHPLTDRSPTEPVHALINPSFRWSAPPRGEIEVRLYCRELKPGNELVALQPDGVSLLGKAVDRTAYDRQRRMLRIAALVLLGAALIGIWVFGGVER
ncbi:MAG: hypothetical protein P9F19_18535 [Candidatus Contendobacter sp.]|nr:hypothetical protein [Candidatus Contendobacter sp.]MDG4559366.1 hypothetical protein [Candidatus Contendobacter sp.]